ncbi:hypothetical protein [Streptomyces djakartensis]|uniref:Uncharacterized protein n=1 Tax=Streptomyces djakartensis TaxID=68193 RepID=A0ABQ2ZPZ9_9ACTN|nr:hypothetical protein [Streptomyces djakartensis]GGY19830.1 hypothetical protein GCM10010384_27830 [Streptomyces djakartensis]
MGDRLSRDAGTGLRRAHPGDAEPGPWDPRDDAALQAALATALLADDPGPEAEQRAVAAFRTARDAGTHRARTRHRDDWRPPAVRRGGRPVKATFAAVFTSIALGGVAVAAIGSVGSSENGTGGRTAHPSATAPAPPDAEASPSSSGSRGPGDDSSSAWDTEAHCRAYARVKDRGKTLDATAWQRLVAVAGGEDEVDAYCAERLVRPAATPSGPGDTDGSGEAGRAGEGAAEAGAGGAGGVAGNAGDPGSPGNGNPGTGRAGEGRGQ